MNQHGKGVTCPWVLGRNDEIPLGTKERLLVLPCHSIETYWFRDHRINGFFQFSIFTFFYTKLYGRLYLLALADIFTFFSISSINE